MPRKQRIEKPGFHHVINRGVEQRDIFIDDEDFDTFLSIIKEAFDFFEVQMHCYVLMSNHYHLLVENQKENLSNTVRQINANYSIYFNKKYNRVGHLWQGRFKSWYINDEKYLYTLIRYIERNPLKAKITTQIGQYKYSSLFEILQDKVTEKSILYHSLLMSDFSKKSLYDFLDIDLNDDDKEVIDLLYKRKMEQKSYTTTSSNTLSLDDIIVANDDKFARNRSIYEAYKLGFSQSQISNFIGLTQGTISAIIKLKKEK